MRINELQIHDVIVGLRLRSIKDPNKLGTIVRIDTDDDGYAWIRWDGDDQAWSGFYGNDCMCDVV